GRKNRRTKRRTTTRQKEREREAEAGRLAGRKRGGNRFLDRLLDSSLFGRARQMRAELPRTHYHQTSARVFCSILAAFPEWIESSRARGPNTRHKSGGGLGNPSLEELIYTLELNFLELTLNKKWESRKANHEPDARRTLLREAMNVSQQRFD
ncbi:unnamed protein product, partial [Prorocentrum cordatum]